MATLVRWEPFREMAALQNELSRFMNNLGDGDGESQRWVPAVDIWETENAIVYAFDLPGVDQDKINVEVENETLTVSAERERTQEESRDRFYRFERRYGTFSPRALWVVCMFATFPAIVSILIRCAINPLAPISSTSNMISILRLDNDE